MTETTQGSQQASGFVTQLRDIESNSNLPLLHLIYIHGFQGDDTSFQSFPLHLQEHLSHILSENAAKYPFRIQSSLYPTYKSIKHLSYATNNFLEWLKTQPPGPVILLGHSMGGLLAAEAALDSSNAHRKAGGKPKRIVGIVAFDVPFLGMHPHVVISGLASLLPKGDSSDDESKKKTPPTSPLPQTEVSPARRTQEAHGSAEARPDITRASSSVTDDWEKFKTKINNRRNPRSPGAEEDPYLDVPGRNGSRSPSPTLSARSASPGPSSAASTRSSNRSSLLSGRRSPLLAKALDVASPYISQATSYIQARADDPIARWVLKHTSSTSSEGLVKASKRWVLERMQFGGCMFDPSELKERYEKLLKWGNEGGGIWVNYYTVTDPKALAKREREREREKERDTALIQSGLQPPEESEEEAQKKRAKLKKSKEAQAKGVEEEDRELEKEKGHHFNMLPSSSVFVQAGRNVFPGRVSNDPLDSWPRVIISGAGDEVEAHCGLFMPKMNLDYDGFVRTVGQGILGWCEQDAEGWGLNGS